MLILGILLAGDWDRARGDGALRLPTGGVGQGGGVPRGLPEMFETGLLVDGSEGPLYPQGFRRRLGLMLDFDLGTILGLWDLWGV